MMFPLLTAADNAISNLSNEPPHIAMSILKTFMNKLHKFHVKLKRDIKIQYNDLYINGLIQIEKNKLKVLAEYYESQKAEQKKGLTPELLDPSSRIADFSNNFESTEQVINDQLAFLVLLLGLHRDELN